MSDYGGTQVNGNTRRASKLKQLLPLVVLSGAALLSACAAPADAQMQAQAGTVNVANFGATGDGVHNDTAAFLAAIAAAKAMPTGGTVIVPVPSVCYRLTSSLILPSGYAPVNLIGSGSPQSTVLKWTQDLGAGVNGVDFDGLQPFANFCRIENLTLSGPNVTGTLGSSPCQMGGLHAISRVHLANVKLGSFRYGLSVSDDHNYFTAVSANGCYYGVYLPGDSNTHGNNSFIDCDFTGSLMASVGVSQNDGLAGATFTDSHLGFSPYGIYKEPGAGGGSFIGGCDFVDTPLEACGNACVYDPNNGDDMSDTTFGCMTMDASYALQNTPTPALVYAPIVHACKFAWGHVDNLPQFTPGSDGFIEATNYGADCVVEPGHDLASHVQGSGKQLFVGNWVADDVVVQDQFGGPWHATPYYYGGTISQYMAVQTGGGNVTASNGTLPVVGIAAVGAVGGQRGLIATSGVEPVIVNTPVFAGQYLAVDPTFSGRVKAVAKSNDLHIIGIAEANQPLPGGFVPCLIKIQN